MQIQRFLKFWWRCARIAFWGNAPFANDWQWLLGYPATALIVSVAGYFYADLSGRIELTLTNGAIGLLVAAVIAFVITWLVAFLARLLNQPVMLYFDEKARADKLEQNVVGQGHIRPSFEIGYEILPLLPEEYEYKSHPRHPACRIWVENLGTGPIDECQIAIEQLKPNMGVHAGALLLPDQRAGDATPNGLFHLAGTQRRYFKFLELGHETGTGGTFADRPAVWELSVRSEQDKLGFAAINDQRIMTFGTKYNVTLAVHGKDATNRRA